MKFLDTLLQMSERKFRFAIFFSLVYSMFPKDLIIQNSFVFIATDIVQHCGRKSPPPPPPPVHHYRKDYIFWSFGIIGFIFSYLEKRILPVLEGMVRFCIFITGHEVCYFLGSCSKGPKDSEHIDSFRVRGITTTDTFTTPNQPNTTSSDTNLTK